MADECERTFLFPVAKQGYDALNGLGLENVTPNAVNGVGRIDDDSTILETLHDLVNGALVRILGIDFQ